MKSLLTLVLVGAFSFAPLSFADDHTLIDKLFLDYPITDGATLPTQCNFEASRVAGIMKDKLQGIPIEKVLAEVKQFALNPNNEWTKGDALFVANAVKVLYDDPETYAPLLLGSFVYQVCLTMRSAEPTIYI